MNGFSPVSGIPDISLQPFAQEEDRQPLDHQLPPGVAFEARHVESERLRNADTKIATQMRLRDPTLWRTPITASISPHIALGILRSALLRTPRSFTFVERENRKLLPRLPLPRHARNIPTHVAGTLLGTQSFLRGISLRRSNAALVHHDAPMQILVRHNLLLTGSPQWSLGAGISMDDYRAALFAPERLKRRLALLRGLLIPSLASQTLPMRRGLRELVLCVSDEMPASYSAALEEAIASFDWIRILAFSASATTVAPTGPATAHLSLRIDDDDALSRNFLARLSFYFRPECTGHAITFPAGYLMRLSDAAPPRFGFIWRPKLSMGLAYLAGPGTRYASIFDLQPHNNIDRMAPTIFGDAAPAWLRTLHQTQDSGDHRHSRTDPRLTLARVQQAFDLDPTRLQPARS